MKSLVKRFVKSSLASFDIEIKKRRNSYAWIQAYGIKTIFDIGANKGDFVIDAHKYFPEANIHAFEPLRAEYNYLVKACRRVPNVKIYNLALGDFNGKSKMYHNDFTPASSIRDMSEKHKEAYPAAINTIVEDIDVVRLDELVDRDIKIDNELLIKIDVQGYEDKVIAGGNNVFNKASVVIIEVCFQELYEGQMLFGDLYNSFLKRGFEFKGVTNIGFHQRSGQPLWSDAVFVNKRN